MNGNIAIQVKDLSKVYKLYDNPVDRLKESLHPFRKKYHKDFYALRNISFEVKKGESIGVIGKNGSGKSTLLKILTGVLTPTSGTIAVNGKVSSLLELGAGFNPELTGIENIYFSGSISGYSKMEMDDKLEGILAFADIGEFVHQSVKTYSSGMFVRLAFANAISVDPDILIVDEALSVGDIFFQQKCHARMEELVKKGTTIVVVSHDMSAIEKYSAKVVMLNQGQLMFLGNPNEAVHRYYAQLFSRPMSHLRTRTVDLEKLAHMTHGSISNVITNWPQDDVFLDISDATIIGSTDVVKCNAVAICNELGEACKEFRTGETAFFYVEFEALCETDVPLSGVEIINSMNIVVYSKSSMHFQVDAPPHLKKGWRIRFMQTINLPLFPGDYTYIIGFSTMKTTDYDHAGEVGSDFLHSKMNPVLRMSRLGKFTIKEKEQGMKLPFYGLVNLDGSATCEVLAT